MTGSITNYLMDRCLGQTHRTNKLFKTHPKTRQKINYH